MEMYFLTLFLVISLCYDSSLIPSFSLAEDYASVQFSVSVLTILHQPAAESLKAKQRLNRVQK